MKEIDSLDSAIRRLGSRDGVRTVLRALGFNGPLIKVSPPPISIAGVRYAGVIARDTCDAHLIQVQRFQRKQLYAIGRTVQQAYPARHHVIVVAEPFGSRVVLGCDALATGMRHLLVDRAHLRPSDIHVLHEMVALADESGLAHALRIMRALDQSRVTDRFFRDVTAIRDAVSRAWTGLACDAIAERDALALLLLSRLMFLYFLQRRCLLAGDPAYLVKLLRSWRRGGSGGTFFRVRLRTLFFGVLNTRRERRSPRALSLGNLPYLNGGLFEPHHAETAVRDLDLPDAVVTRVFDDLLEKYRFTSGDEEDIDGIGVDPEMLGRIFEGLMPREGRARTGTFYTPVAVVQRVVLDTLAEHLSGNTGIGREAVVAALRGDGEEETRAVVAKHAESLRVLDPACGSGAFLLGALAPLARLRCGEDARTHVVGQSLHGVDVLSDAALICSLRLWLALIPNAHRVEDVPPLPNLDRRIRQGDALIDPVDIHTATTGASMPRELRDILGALEPASSAYLTAGPESKALLRRRISQLERRLALAWLSHLEGRLDRDRRELEARSHDRDLFGDTSPQSASAMRQLAAVSTRLHELRATRMATKVARTLPFFSFRVHFPETTGGFDIILCNPPWVRSHKWPPAIRDALRERYEVCRQGGWPYASRLTRSPCAAGSQVDLSLLFLERCIALLAPGGTLGMILPAKLMRSLYGAGARSLLLREMDILSIEDHSLDQTSVFDADAFTMILIARRRADHPSGELRLSVVRGGGDSLRFDVSHGDLPLLPGDPRSPWLIAPPACLAVFRSMQRAGTPIGEQGITIRRGIMTRVNDVLLVRDFEPRLGDIAMIRTEAHARTRDARFAGWVGASVVRPAIRGSDIRPWCARPTRHLLWSPANDVAGAAIPPRLRRFLNRHRDALAQPTHLLGTVYRRSPHLDCHRVMWSDLASDLRAVPVPPRLRTAAGIDLPVVPLNSVYFIPTHDDREALILAAYLNSAPVRAFARTIAERAKDAHYRFFAWTIAVLPLPIDWRTGRFSERLYQLASAAASTGGMNEDAQRRLDDLVASSFGIDAAGMESVREFDTWTRSTL